MNFKFNLKNRLVLVLTLVLTVSLLFFTGATVYNLTYNSSTSFAFFNATGLVNGTGLALSPPVLFMDFNQLNFGGKA